MTATLSNWGNSQGLRLSKEILKELHLAIGDKLNVSIENQKIILEPIKKRKKYNISDLVAKMPNDYKATEELSDKAGKEEW
jgi:antitoxin component of MazEF toxin-antitoxin module